MFKFLFTFFFLLCASFLFAAIPEQWLQDKADVEIPISREACFVKFPRKHIAIATLPEHFADAFEVAPVDLKIYVGEGYFIDHALNHHPDVEDVIYRSIEEILEAPDEVIIDRRKGHDSLVFHKTIHGKGYALVVRHYHDNHTGGQLVYKTLFPVGKSLYPKLPRVTLTKKRS